MRNKNLGVLVLSLVLLSVFSISFASALSPGNTGFAVLDDGISVNMGALEGICSEDSCIIDVGSTWKTIVFRLNDDGDRGTGFSIRYDVDLGTYSLSVFTTSENAENVVNFLPAALKLLSSRNILIGATDEDLTGIEDQLIPGLLLEGGSVPEGMTGSSGSEIPDYTSLTALSLGEDSSNSYLTYSLYGLVVVVFLLVVFFIFKKKK